MSGLGDRCLARVWLLAAIVDGPGPAVAFSCLRLRFFVGEPSPAMARQDSALNRVKVGGRVQR